MELEGDGRRWRSRKVRDGEDSEEEGKNRSGGRWRERFGSNT